MGNSDIVINSQFFKEFGYRPNSKSADEKVETREDKAFYQSMGYEFIRKVIPSIVSQSEEDGTRFARTLQFPEETERIERLQALEESLYTQYGTRKEEVALNKENDPKIPTELVQVVEGSEKRQDTLKKTYQNICRILGMQATNVTAWRCDS